MMAVWRRQSLVFLHILLLCGVLCTAEEDVEAGIPEGTTVLGSEVVENEIVYITPQPTGSVHFVEHFDDSIEFGKKWVKSQAQKDDTDENIAKYDGVWEIETAEKDALKGDQGLVLKSKAKHHAISARLQEPFVFNERPLVVQYEVNFQSGQECGGAYMKLLTHDKNLDLTKFHDKTPYTIMFGPDKCGNDYKVHFIFRHKNPVNGSFEEKHCKRPSVKLEDYFKDAKSHLYTLVIKPDNSFQVLVDQVVINKGSLLEDFTPPINPPREIEDVNDKKPAEWDDRAKIPDASAVKPDDWDENAPTRVPVPNSVKPESWLENEPENIADPNAVRPADWDDEMDGTWEAPLISNPKCENVGCGEWKAPMMDNPAYKGKWLPPQIDNPVYKGKWEPRKIPNPQYFEDREPFKMSSLGAVGLELWSINDNIMFDNVIITDDRYVADHWASETWQLKKAKADKDGDGVLSRIMNFTNAHPWLWAVYIVVIGIPLVLFMVFCCTSADDKDSRRVTTAAAAKKTDLASPDDERKDVIEEQEENDETPAPEEPVDAPGTPRRRKDSLEASNEEVEEIEEEEEEASNEPHEGGDAGDSNRSPRRRRPRKE